MDYLTVTLWSPPDQRQQGFFLVLIHILRFLFLSIVHPAFCPLEGAKHPPNLCLGLLSSRTARPELEASVHCPRVSGCHPKLTAPTQSHPQCQRHQTAQIASPTIYQSQRSRRKRRKMLVRKPEGFPPLLSSRLLGPRFFRPKTMRPEEILEGHLLPILKQRHSPR